MNGLTKARNLSVLNVETVIPNRDQNEQLIEKLNILIIIYSQGLNLVIINPYGSKRDSS